MIYDTNILVGDGMGTRDIWIVIFDNYNTIVNLSPTLSWTLTDTLRAFV